MAFAGCEQPATGPADGERIATPSFSHASGSSQTHVVLPGDITTAPDVSGDWVRILPAARPSSAR